MTLPSKVDIGNVGFARTVTQADKAAYKMRFHRGMPEHIRLTGFSVMGDRRVNLLRAAFRGEVLPDGLVLVANYSSGPRNVPITRDEVRWAIEGEGSAGGRVVDGLYFAASELHRIRR